jgi:hypothetical protein
MATTLHYVAYGSNLHPLRINQRVPSAKVIDVIELPRRQVNFHKRSIDGSGKCNLSEDPSVSSYGVLYEFKAGERAALNRLEGFGRGYREAILTLSVQDTLYSPYTYVAESSYINTTLRPYDWYKAFVVQGARHHKFPETYIARLESVDCIVDADPTRRSENLSLLDQMKSWRG